MPATSDSRDPGLYVTQPVALCAFEGWNDAAGAATDLIDLLWEEWDLAPEVELDAEAYYDLQVARPLVLTGENDERSIEWPTTSISSSPDGRIVLVSGIEPSMRWRTFCDEVLDHLATLGVRTVVTLGALLADVPHTRPISVSVSTSSVEYAERLDIDRSTYEGPTGIVGILELAAHQRGFDSLSAWAAVPHYVSQPPCPPATEALARRLEDLLGSTLPLGDLAEKSGGWRQMVDHLAAESDDVAEYVSKLESASDAAELSQASGDSIAREFERYLRRRDTGPKG